MANISNLDPLTPTGGDPVSGGDNQLRTLKNALVGDGTASNGSFTPGFTGQYTGTADDLNLVATAAQPADGVSFFDDVDTTGAAVGDMLQFDGAEWVPITKGLYVSRWTGAGGATGSQVKMVTQISNDIPAGVGTIDNTNINRGWTFTAVVDCTVNISFQFIAVGTFGGSAALNLVTGIGLNAADGASALDVCYSNTQQYGAISQIPRLTGSVAAAIKLSAADTLTLHAVPLGAGAYTASPSDARLSIAVAV